MAKFLKIPKTFNIINYIGDIPFIEKKNSEQILNESKFKIKWSWFKHVIKIEGKDDSFSLYPTEIVKCNYCDVDNLILEYYDIIGKTKLPSTKRMTIILNNKDKINEILKKKKCPLIPDNTTFWVSHVEYLYMDNMGNLKKADLLNDMHTPLFIQEII